MYQMLVNYLNSVRPKSSQYIVTNEQAVKPFTVEAAKMLCERSSGVPRWLNRLGSYVLLKAAELNAKVINADILKQGFIYTDQQVRGQLGLTPIDLMILDPTFRKAQYSTFKKKQFE